MNLPNELLQLILNYLDQSSKYQLYRTAFYHLRSLSPIMLRTIFTYKKDQVIIDKQYNLYEEIYNNLADTIKMIDKGNLKSNWMPPSIRTLDTNNFNILQIPSTITELILYHPKTNPIFDEVLPNLIILIIISKIDLWLDDLPVTLKFLKINGLTNYIRSIKLPLGLIKFNMNIKLKGIISEILPAIQTLKLGVNEVVDELPDSITKIKLYGNFHTNIDYLPKNLKQLMLDMKKLDGKLNFLPSSLKILIINTELKYNLDKLPQSLKILIINLHAKINYPMNKLPNNLECLIFSKSFNYEYEIISLPASIIKLVLPRSYEYPIPYLPSVRKIACGHKIRYFSNDVTTLSHLIIYEIFGTHNIKSIDEYKKYYDKIYDVLFSLPPVVIIDSNILHNYSVNGVKKLILKNCAEYFYQVFDIEKVVIIAPYKLTCSKLYGTFMKGNADIKRIVFEQGIIVNCTIQNLTYEEIEFYSGIKEISFYCFASVIRCPDTLVNFVLYTYNKDNYRSYGSDTLITIILPKITKEFRVFGQRKGKINFPVIPRNMFYCDVRFLSTFVPARFIEC